MYLINQFSPLYDKTSQRQISVKNGRHQPTLERHFDGIDTDEWRQQIRQSFQRKSLRQVRVEGDPFQLVQGLDLASDEGGDFGEDSLDGEVVLPVFGGDQALVQSNEFGGSLTVDKIWCWLLVVWQYI